MGRPTETELEMALDAAALMRERGEDPYHVASALLSHDDQLHQLQRAVSAAEAYLHSGMAEHEHAQLVRALGLLRESDGGKPPRFGLE